MAEPQDPAARPDPDQARTPAEFVDAMVRLKRWTGWGYRRLEKQARAAGQVLPRSTLTNALNRPALPREDLIAALVIACGGDQAEADRWAAARRRIAATPDPASQPEPPRTTAGPTLWRIRVVSAAAVLVLAVGAGLTWRVNSSDDRTLPAAPTLSQPAPVTPSSTHPVISSAPPTSTPVLESVAPPPAASSTPGPVGPAAAGTTSKAAPAAITVTITPPLPAPVVRSMSDCVDATIRNVGDHRVEVPAHEGSADCLLSYGATGDAVRALQASLINCNNAGYVTITGVYDQKTWDAVAFIQVATGAKQADGNYRPEFRDTIYWLHDGEPNRTCVRYAGA